MSERELARKLTLKRRIMLLSAICILFVSMLLPLFQKGIATSYRTGISESEVSLLAMESEIRILESEIAGSKSPEHLIGSMMTKSIDYESIGDSSEVVIARR